MTDGTHIPGVAETFPGYDYCYCISAKPKQVSPIMWMVACEYKGEAGGDITGKNTNVAEDNL